MRIHNVTVPNNFNLFCFGDVHEGTFAKVDEGWRMCLDMLGEEYEGVKHNIAVDHGDIIESVSVDHPHYDGITTEGNVYQQMQTAMKDRWPLRKKFAVIMDGNHPMRFWKFFGPGKPALTETVCNDLGVKYGGFVAVLNYVDKKGKRMFGHYITHPTRGSMSSRVDDPKRRKLNLKLAVKKKLRDQVGDCILMSVGHFHKLVYCEPEQELYMENDGEKLHSRYTAPRKTQGFIHPDHRHYLCTGSFHRTFGDGYDTYAEMAGYNPVELGFYIVRVRDRAIEGIDEIII